MKTCLFRSLSWSEKVFHDRHDGEAWQRKNRSQSSKGDCRAKSRTARVNKKVPMLFIFIITSLLDFSWQSVELVVGSSSFPHAERKSRASWSAMHTIHSELVHSEIITKRSTYLLIFKGRFELLASRTNPGAQVVEHIHYNRHLFFCQLMWDFVATCGHLWWVVDSCGHLW